MKHEEYKVIEQFQFKIDWLKFEIVYRCNIAMLWCLQNKHLNMI